MPKLFLCALFMAGFTAAAQNDKAGAGTAQGSDAPFEVGLHLGNLLPNQIAGVTEIIGLGGGRVAMRLAPQTYAEAGIIMGNGEGVKWKNIHADLRMDVPIENLVGVAFVGADTIYYRGANQSSDRIIFGGHAGGGVQAHLGGPTWFRADMKFGFSPGTSLYFGFGFQFRLGSGGT